MRVHAGAVIGILLVAQACHGESTSRVSPTPTSMNPSRQDDPGGQKPGPLVRARSGAPVSSPSGEFVLEVVESEEVRGGKAQRAVGFAVRSAGGRTLLAEEQRFAGWFAVRIGWDALNRVWARSDDIGVRMWAHAEDAWREHVWQADGPLTASGERTIWDAETGESLPVIGGPLPEGL